MPNRDGSTTFDEVYVNPRGGSSPNPLEVTLLKGVTFDTIASSFPNANRPKEPTTEPGIVFVGYVYDRDNNYLYMTPDKLQSREMTSLGGWGIHKEAIHSIRTLKY